MIQEFKQKNLTWKLLHSWHVLFCLFFGLSWLTFLYMYIKVRSKKWLLYSLVYFISVVLTMHFVYKYPDANTRPDYVIYYLVFFIFLWLFSIPHSLFSLKEFWIQSLIYESIEKKSTLDLETKVKKEMGAIDNPVDQILLEFNETDLTVKILKFIFENIPFTPQFYYYVDLRGALGRYIDEPSEKIYQELKKIAKFDDQIHKILKTARVIDKIDGGLGILTGIRNGYEIITKKTSERTFEADPQQALDAGIKAIVLGYMISLVSKQNFLNVFLDIKAGQELLYYFVAIELALPFTDNLIESGGSFLYKILQEREKEISSRFIDFSDKNSYLKARSVLEEIREAFDQTSLVVSQNFKRLESNFKNTLPGILNVADSTTGGIATVLDIMPIWKLLGARFAAEVCVYKVLNSENI